MILPECLIAETATLHDDEYCTLSLWQHRETLITEIKRHHYKAQEMYINMVLETADVTCFNAAEDKLYFDQFIYNVIVL